MSYYSTFLHSAPIWQLSILGQDIFSRHFSRVSLGANRHLRRVLHLCSMFFLFIFPQGSTVQYLWKVEKMKYIINCWKYFSFSASVLQLDLISTVCFCRFEVSFLDVSAIYFQSQRVYSSVVYRLHFNAWSFIHIWVMFSVPVWIQTLKVHQTLKVW